ncbi:PLP-dependent aminotransferase family protein [Bacillus thuringiensis]|uniref:aminotransferase-like domain-containing protein n=1 Tax=Bacillus thuringiensis TaxID=1428 RepID=UPI00125FFC4D|nr:PLP-dependent aminotransferase family protein [Bacillus thuringiensis]KAB5636923.1 PLP-dependent aminotransferase family protein [Bacillus thuringiensis]HDR5271696.1 PLP-dependent aminotransferase family protein [Bacillus thuringiensis]
MSINSNTKSFTEFTEGILTLEKSPLHDTLKSLSNPDNLSFGLGLPNKNFFPSEAFTELATKLFDNRSVYQYQDPIRELKKMIVDIMKVRGVDCNENQVVLTHGAQQGVNLLVHLLLPQGGKVITEDIVYAEFMRIIKPYNPDHITVPIDFEEGIDLDALEKLLQSGLRPSLIYNISSGHNPLGINLSAYKKERLAQLARKYSFPIIEDDPYGFLNYDGKNHIPTRSYDADWVFYVGSFSKILAPSFRTGWIIAPEHVVEKLNALKEISDLNTATISHHLILSYLQNYDIFQHINKINLEYASRRDTMINAIKTYFPSTTKFHSPDNGMFLWVQLQEDIDTLELLKKSVEEEKVAFLPGEVFCAKGLEKTKNCMRLNFTNFSHEQIQDGIARLGKSIEKYLSK